MCIEKRCYDGGGGEGRIDASTFFSFSGFFRVALHFGVLKWASSAENLEYVYPWQKEGAGVVNKIKLTTLSLSLSPTLADIQYPGFFLLMIAQAFPVLEGSKYCYLLT
mmetsp:Transcript_28655/g.84442  ORF Transcript_28655/g.84442 Transcript_28655/m.84442 type:complete len:108 (-) Transcript_28655:17-340(-)